MSYHDPFDKEGPVLNVLTRTCNRPNRFRRCADSLKAQETAVSIRHFVSIDRPCTYVDADVLVPATGQIAPEIPEASTRHRDAPYNLFVNDLLAAVKDGWILVLDDDDELLRRDAVAILEPYLADEDNMVVFKFAMGDGLGKKNFVMPKAHGKALVINDVPCSCYVYHSKHKVDGLWHGKYSGDFFAASNLADKLNVVWVDEVLAGTQTGPSMGTMDCALPSTWEPRLVKQEKVEPFVSIIIPVLNQSTYTKELLENIANTTSVPHEVIVVDNGSTDNTPDVLKNAGVKVIRNQRNNGWAYALNQGASKAKGTHLAFLNNDVVLPPNWLLTLLSHDEHAVCPTYEQDPVIPKHFRRRNQTLEAQEREVVPAERPGLHPKGFAGFVFMISREAWERVGRFDETMIYWCADNDYYVRLKAMGYRPMMSKNVLIHHFMNKTVDTLPDYLEQRERDRQTFLAKWPEAM